MPSHTAAIPRPTAPNARETGPGPLRTARGAGRAADRRLDAPDRLRPFAELVRGLGRLLVLRDRVLEPLVLDVLELRDPGGEDVRVAMLGTLRLRPTSHMHHRVRVAAGCRHPPERRRRNQTKGAVRVTGISLG